MTEGGGVALLLQVEAMGVDAARGIDGKRKLEVNRGLRAAQSWDVRVGPTAQAAFCTS